MNQITKLPESEYRASPGISQSSLKDFYKCPYDAVNGYGRKPSAGYKFGNLLHTYFLEPENIEKEYHIITDIEIENLQTQYALANKGKMTDNLTMTKIYKDYKTEIEQSGKAIITQEEYDKLPIAMANFNEFAEQYIIEGYKLIDIFNNSQKEVVVYADREGLQLKGKLDMLFIDDFSKKIIIIDLKTIEDIDKAEKQVTDFKYYWQEVFYIMLLKLNGYEDYEFIFQDIFIKSSEPYHIKPVVNDLLLLDYGQEEIETALQMIKDYLSGEFVPKPYKLDITRVYKPSWWKYE